MNWWFKSTSHYPSQCRRTASIMMTSSNGNIFRVTGHLCGKSPLPGEFPTQRPVTRSFDVFYDLRLNKRLSKQWWGWWFETQSRPLWRHRNGTAMSLYDSVDALWQNSNTYANKKHGMALILERWYTIMLYNIEYCQVGGIKRYNTRLKLTS